MAATDEAHIRDALFAHNVAIDGILSLVETFAQQDSLAQQVRINEIKVILKNAKESVDNIRVKGDKARKEAPP